MQERSIQSTHSDELDYGHNNNPSRHHFYFFRAWLDQFETNKLECYSVIFGILGISFIVLGICIIIMIDTTYDDHLMNTVNCSIINVTHTHIKLCPSRRCQIFNYCIPYVCTSKLTHVFALNSFVQTRY